MEDLENRCDLLHSGNITICLCCTILQITFFCCVYCDTTLSPWFESLCKMMDSPRKSSSSRKFQWFYCVGTETDHVISAVFVNGFQSWCDINYFPIYKTYIVTDQCETLQFMHQPFVENTLISIHSVTITLSYNISFSIHNWMSQSLEWILFCFSCNCSCNDELCPSPGQRLQILESPSMNLQ